MAIFKEVSTKEPLARINPRIRYIESVNEQADRLVRDAEQLERRCASLEARIRKIIRSAGGEA